MNAANCPEPLTVWGRWLADKTQAAPGQLASDDIAELNLQCASDLPGTENELLHECLSKVDDWTLLIEQFTEHIFDLFEQRPENFDHSESRFRVAAMTEFIQRHLKIPYNQDFAIGEYDGSDSRNLFIHGILTGYGGTCVTLPVLYCAIGRRLGYPIGLGETWEHIFCRWDDPGGDSFCFDAAGSGYDFRDEDYYRNFVRPLEASQERRHGFIRRMTASEELALFACLRGNCLQDNLLFPSALEAFYFAHRLAPNKRCINDAWALAHYSSQIWSRIPHSEAGNTRSSLEHAIEAAVGELGHLNLPACAKPAAKDLLRILRNRSRRNGGERHERVFETFSFDNPFLDHPHV